MHINKVLLLIPMLGVLFTGFNQQALASPAEESLRVVLEKKRDNIELLELALTQAKYDSVKGVVVTLSIAGLAAVFGKDYLVLRESKVGVAAVGTATIAVVTGYLTYSQVKEAKDKLAAAKQELISLEAGLSDSGEE